MAKVLVIDPATTRRDGWHDLIGNSEDALNGNISRVFLTGVPFSVPTTDIRQPDNWSCGPYSLGQCLGQNSGEYAREWLLDRGLIDFDHGTYYSGIVGYINSNGYSCDYDGVNYDGVMNGNIYNKIISHLNNGYKIILCMHHSKNTYWTESGHYITVYGIERGDHEELKVDGKWGKQTTLFAQKKLHTTEDGIISNQNNIMEPFLPACENSSWEFVDSKELQNGSELVKAIQRLIGVPADGFFGIQTVVAFNKYFLNAIADEYIGYQSVKAFQRWLNAI